jgi:hypothetical protein
MLSVLVAVALTPIVYSFPKEAKVGYDVDFSFSGFIPVMGGLEGDAKVKLGFEVGAADQDKDGNARTTCELKAFKLTINDAEIPYGLQEVAKFFPKNTVTMTPQGKVLKTDVPDVKLPVRLPGLDVKRFPDVSFLPIEFPVEGIEVGKEWTYKKAFGDSDVSFTVKATVFADDKIEMDVKLAQAYDTFEDEAKNVVADERDAISKVHTDMAGTGKVTFDRKLGIIRASLMEGKSVSRAVDLQTRVETERKLTMTVKTALREKNAAPWK